MVEPSHERLPADETVIRRPDRFADWALVGLRDNPGRTAYGIARLVQSHGKTIVPGPPERRDGPRRAGRRRPAGGAGRVDVVGVYRGAAHAGEVADEAIKLFASYGAARATARCAPCGSRWT